MQQRRTKWMEGLRWSDNIYRALLLYFVLAMASYSLCRVGFYLFNTSFFPDMTFGRFMRIMFGGLRFDLPGVLYSNALFIILFILPVPFRFHPAYKKILFWLFVVINSAALATNVADFIYYRFTLRRTTISVLSQFQNEQNLTGLFFHFVVDYWYAVLCWAALSVALFLLARKITFSGPQLRNKWSHYISSLVMMLFIVVLFVGGARGGFAHSTRPITLSNAGEYAAQPKDINIVLNTPFALLRTSGTSVIEKVHYFASDDELNKIFTPVHLPPVIDHSRRPVQGADSSTFRYDNVVVIILESFSREFVGAYNTPADPAYQAFTPFMDSLIGKSKAWQYSFANGRKSIDAMPSVISSIPSIEVPYVLSHYSGNTVNSLASILKEKGYSTSFFHGAPNGSMGFQAFANLTGFDRYYGKTEYDHDEDYDGIWGIWDEKFLQFYVNKLNTFKPPFYSTVFTVSSHHPYNLPPGYDKRFKGGSMIIYRTIEYTDFALKRFFSEASKMPWFKNTLFVLTADHASAEIHYPQYNTAWGYFSIPIFFYKGGADWSSFDPGIIQQIDIMPTILGYLNYDKPYIAFGRDVFSNTSTPYAFNYINNTYQIFMDDYLLLFDGNKPIALYDFKKDVLLKTNLLDKLPEQTVKMETFLKALIQQYNNRMVDDNLTMQGPQTLIKK